MLNKPKNIITAVLCLLVQLATAQEKVSLQDAVNYALRYKAEAVKARLDVINSNYKIAEVKANALPQVNASGGITYNAILQQTALNMNGQTMVIKMGQPWQSTATLQADQQIFNMSVFQGLKAAKSTREFYLINAELTEEQIIEKVANSYYEIFKTRSQIKTIENTINNTSRIKEVLVTLFENGLAKKIDIDRITVSLNNLTSNKQQLQNAQALQENSLKYLIGMEISTPISLPDNTFEIGSFPYLEKNTVINQRSEIRLLEKQGELLRYNKKSIEAQRYPTVSVSANYGFMGLGSRFPYFSFKSDRVNWADFSSLALNVKIPIFTGYSNRSKLQQAQIEIDKFEADLNDTRLALSLGVENAYTQVKNAFITLNAQKSNMGLAQNVLTNVENNYRNGLATLTDLLDAETSYSDAQNSYTNAIMEYKVAEVQLIKSKGELKTFYTTN